MAVNCCFVPAGIESVLGVTESEVRTAGVTVNTAEPLMAPELAVMVAVPWAALAANPVALTVATVFADEVH